MHAMHPVPVAPAWLIHNTCHVVQPVLMLLYRMPRGSMLCTVDTYDTLMHAVRQLCPSSVCAPRAVSAAVRYHNVLMSNAGVNDIMLVP